MERKIRKDVENDLINVDLQVGAKEKKEKKKAQAILGKALVRLVIVILCVKY